jgi:hypothetical protein
MNGNGQVDGWFDGNLYNENRNKFPAGELQKYVGQWVAFSTDGTRILAAHEDMLTLAKMLKDAGYRSSEVVFCPVRADEVGQA